MKNPPNYSVLQLTNRIT